MQPLLKQALVGPRCYKAVSERFLNIWLAAPSTAEKQTEKALPRCCSATAVTETSLGWGFFVFKKMQFLDTAVVKLEGKIGIHSSYPSSSGTFFCQMQLYKGAAVTLLNPGFVLPLDHLPLQSRGYPWPVSAKPKGSQKWIQSKPTWVCNLQV